jgi:hypothetical protein
MENKFEEQQPFLPADYEEPDIGAYDLGVILDEAFAIIDMDERYGFYSDLFVLGIITSEQIRQTYQETLENFDNIYQEHRAMFTDGAEGL